MEMLINLIIFRLKIFQTKIEMNIFFFLEQKIEMNICLQTDRPVFGLLVFRFLILIIIQNC